MSNQDYNRHSTLHSQEKRLLRLLRLLLWLLFLWPLPCCLPALVRRSAYTATGASMPSTWGELKMATAWLCLCLVANTGFMENPQSSKEPWQSRSPILWPQTPSASSGLPGDLHSSYGEHTPRSPVSQKPLSIFMVYVQSSFQSSPWRWGVRRYQCSPEKFHKACQDSCGIIHCSPP